MGRTDGGGGKGRRRASALPSRVLLALFLAAMWLRPTPTGAIQTPEAAGWAEPVVAAGVAYVGVWLDPGGDLLLALDTATGAQRWRFRADHTLIAAPTVVDGVVYVGDDAFARDRDRDGVAGTVYALDAATGAERWRAATNRGVLAAPAVADGVVYVIDGFSDSGLQDNGTAYALDAVSGDERWRVAVGGATCAAPAVADGLVYVRSGSTAPSPGPGALLALDAATGAVRWRVATAGTCGGGEFRPAAVPAALDDGAAYVRGADGALVALDAATGTERWRADGGPEGVEPTVGDGIVIAADGAAVVALGTGDGAKRWRVALAEGANGPPSLVGGIVYVQTLFEVIALGGERGDERWRARSGLVNGPVVGDAVYAGGAVSDLIALDAATGKPRWSLAPPGIDLRLVAATAELVFLTGDDGLLRALNVATGRVRWVVDPEAIVPGGVGTPETG